VRRSGRTDATELVSMIAVVERRADSTATRRARPGRSSAPITSLSVLRRHPVATPPVIIADVVDHHHLPGRKRVQALALVVAVLDLVDLTSLPCLWICDGGAPLPPP
jgi:hypothetical protein